LALPVDCRAGLDFCSDLPHDFALQLEDGKIAARNAFIWEDFL
jgi:hypothetical protein